MTSIPSNLQQARAAIARARLAFRRGDREEALALIDAVPAQLGESEAPESAAVQLDAIALRAFHTGNIERCLSAQTAAIALLQRIGDRWRVTEALIRDAGARMVSGREGVLERLAEARAEAETIGDCALVARVATTAAMHALREARPAEALEQAAVGAAAGRRAGARGWVVTAEGTGAAAALAMGDAHACVEHVGRALHESRGAPTERATLDLRLLQVPALVATRQVDQAQREVDEIGAHIHPDDKSLCAKLALAQGLVHRARGELDAARRRLLDARERFEVLQDRTQIGETTVVLLDIAAETGAREEAAQRLHELRLTEPAPPIAALAEARAALLLSSPEDAVAAAIEAAGVARTAGAPKLADDARALAVQAARATGDLAHALELCEALAEARSQADTLRQQGRARAELAAQRFIEQADALDRDTAEGELAELTRVLRAEHGERIDALAHGARNRLAAVAACGDLLALPTPPRPRAELVDQLHVVVASLGEMIDEAATQARDPGVTERGAGPTPLAPLAYRVVAIFAARAEQKGIDLQVRVRSPCRSSASPAVVRDALENLVSNALKFCDRGDAVRVTVDATDDAVTLGVRDTGPGLTPADQAHLFLPRARLTPRPTAGEPSSGLGLWLTHGAITRAGGTLEVESHPGQGCEFRLRLPRT